MKISGSAHVVDLSCIFNLQYLQSQSVHLHVLRTRDCALGLVVKFNLQAYTSVYCGPHVTLYEGQRSGSNGSLDGYWD